MKNLWPSWRYRRLADGGIESRIFNGPGEVIGDGWRDSPAFIDDATEISDVNSTKEQENGEESIRPEDGHESEGTHGAEGRQEFETGDGKERQGREVLNFDGLSKDDLIAIADKGGVKIDRRWGRDRIEAALRAADGNG